MTPLLCYFSLHNASTFHPHAQNDSAYSVGYDALHYRGLMCHTSADSVGVTDGCEASG